MSSKETADTTGRTVDLTASERHSLLAVERRRLALEILADETPPTTLETLATEIIAREDGSGATDPEYAVHVIAALHHAHLPKLAEVGVIGYDPRSHRIDPTGMIVDADGRL